MVFEEKLDDRTAQILFRGGMALEAALLTESGERFALASGVGEEARPALPPLGREFMQGYTERLRAANPDSLSSERAFVGVRSGYRTIISFGSGYMEIPGPAITQYQKSSVTLAELLARS